jgi:intermediate peptidase
VPFVDGTFWHTRFSHLYGYGSGYYSYLWAKAYAAHLWHGCFAADPLSGAAGQAYREKILRKGGGAEPEDMIRELLPRKPRTTIVDSFLHDLRCAQ